MYIKGVYRFEWITEEDVVNLTSLRGENLEVTTRNCSLFLSAREAGSERSRATFLLEEWISEDRLVIWAAEKVQSGTGDFVGVSGKYLQNTLARIAGKKRCSTY